MASERVVSRVALAGGVAVSRRVLEALLRHGTPVCGVLGYEPESAALVSGYARMDDVARRHEIPYVPFKNVNEESCVAALRAWKPDLLFVVGLSQLAKPAVLEIPRIGCVGFHPTRLPEGRGRAPVPWMILEGRSGAATFFLMDSGVDSGPILAQHDFDVRDTDYASDVHARVEEALDRALDKWLPTLPTGNWTPIPQDESRATYRGRRAPEDGEIVWDWTAEDIARLVRASSHPYPGAYTFAQDAKVTVWRADVFTAKTIRGVAGRVVEIDNGAPVVQTGQGLLRLTEVESTRQGAPLKIGERLGTPARDVARLGQRVTELEATLAKLVARMGPT